MITPEEVWRQLVAGPKSQMMLRAAMRRVVHSLSDMIGAPITYSPPKVKKIPISAVATQAGLPDSEMVGIYLRIETGLRGQAILILPLAFALNLVDLVMETAPGTSVDLGIMERSALGEVGNLTLSYFLNEVAEFYEGDLLLQPSPPVVMVDMLGAILNVIAAPAAFVGDDLLVIETIFRDAARTVWGRFWVLPDPTMDWSEIVCVKA